MRVGILAGIVGATLLLGHGVAGAAPLSAAERCRVVKIGGISASTVAHLGCVAQAVKHARPVAASCVANADAKLVRAFTRAEKVASCPPSLASAQADIASFVATQSAAVLATPTPTATPAATPLPGCGNGLTEPGENCDGGPYCDASCNFAFPQLCCEFGPVCVAVPDIPSGDQCFLAGGTPRIGARCIALDPGCPEGDPCAGSCTPDVFPATAFCCDGGSGCTQSTFSDTESLSFVLLQCGLEGVIQGTCVAGSCVPGG